VTLCVYPPPRDRPRMGLLLPVRSAFAINPIAGYWVAFEVAVLIPISLLKQLQQGVAERRVHPDTLPRVVATDVVASQALFKERFFMCAATVQVPWWSIPRRELAPFPAGIMPGT